MRVSFSNALTELGRNNPETVFLTGDLGYNALEPVSEAMGERFINTGVSEQNMISVGAGLAKTGMNPWCYSIAPFAVFRPFEQIRNDICYHNLPVKIVGNGGGFTYGVMGFTHHAVEDYGVLSTLPNIRIVVPAFSEHIGTIIKQLHGHQGPAYLRLGRAVALADGLTVPDYEPQVRLLPDATVQILAVGPLAPLIAAHVMNSDIDATVWAINEPFADFSEEFTKKISDAGRVLVVEEHVGCGSFASNLALRLLKGGVSLTSFDAISTLQKVLSRTGSENYLRALSGLDPAVILEKAANMLKDKSAENVL